MICTESHFNLFRALLSHVLLIYTGMDHESPRHMASEDVPLASSHRRVNVRFSIGAEDSDSDSEAAPTQRTLVLADGAGLEAETDVDSAPAAGVGAPAGDGQQRSDQASAHVSCSPPTLVATAVATSVGGEHDKVFSDAGANKLTTSEEHSVILGSPEKEADRKVESANKGLSGSDVQGERAADELPAVGMSADGGSQGEPAGLAGGLSPTTAPAAVRGDGDLQASLSARTEPAQRAVSESSEQHDHATDKHTEGIDRTQGTGVQVSGGDSPQRNGVPADCVYSPFVDIQQLAVAGLLRNTEAGQGNVAEQQQHFRSLLQDGPKGKKKLKKLLRSALWGPACGLRQTAWKLICGQFHKLHSPSLYFEMEKEMFGDFADDDDIPLPAWLLPQHHLPPGQLSLSEQFCEHFLTTDGMRTAHKVIMVICHLCPDITFCPALLPLTYLFLHYMDAGSCYSCVSTLLSSKTPVYLTQTKVAAEASKLVLRDLAKKHAKAAFVQLVRNCSNVESVFDDWLMWIYCDLPFAHLVQLTDSYLLEGIKVLYRIALAILILFTKYSGVRFSTDSHVVGNSIRTFCKMLPVSPAKLLKVAFGIRGLTRHTIGKLHERHEKQVVNSEHHSDTAMPRVVSTVSFATSSSAKIQTRALGFQKLESSIITPEMMATIWSWLPVRFALYRPIQLYTSAEHGTSLLTLYKLCDEYPFTIIIIETTQNEIFGAFCAGAWSERHTDPRHISYFGTGETFLFTLVPERCKYEWVGMMDPNVPKTANMFLAGDSTCLFIGGGNGVAISLDETFEHCRTERCDTYNNPPLVPSQDFMCNTVEVFGFQ